MRTGDFRITVIYYIFSDIYCIQLATQAIFLEYISSWRDRRSFWNIYPVGAAGDFFGIYIQLAPQANLLEYISRWRRRRNFWNIYPVGAAGEIFGI